MAEATSGKKVWLMVSGAINPSRSERLGVAWSPGDGRLQWMFFSSLWNQTRGKTGSRAGL